ncbi:MAG: class I SAM-dependent methyltransferase [Deltaproteobacteria bacterium]|nr:class I SAM-dependent methyltransferase [Deltaproteobacteria bacterium]
MGHPTNYTTDTLNAYRSKQRAAEYKRYHTKNWNWARFSTWREQRLLARELSRYPWSIGDRLLDIPCGTGILGKLLCSFPFQIVASDISPEMMELARGEYPVDRLLECVQADITATGFQRGSFDCIVVLGFLHRVPLKIKRAALREISTLAKRVVVITCSVDSPLQRLKKTVLAVIRKEHVPAPCPVSLREIVVECEAAGFKVVRSFMVVPFLSSEAMLVLERGNRHQQVKQD